MHRNRLITLILAIVAVFATVAPASASLRVTVQPGETLSGIASRHGVSVGAIVRANGLGNMHLVVAGSRLTVPTGGSSAGSSTGAGTYTVQPGDTLSGIAAKFGVSVGAITTANGLSNAHMVIAGTRLRISGGAVQGRSATWVGGGTYTVQSGDTLSSIAARTGTNASTLARINGIGNPNLVVVGTRLRVTGSAATSTSGGGAGATSGGYTVQSGDTLSSIASRFGTSAQAIATANGITNPNLVVVGTRLRISGSSSSSSSSSGMTQGPLTPITAATAGWGNQPSRSRVADLMAQSAARHGVDVALVRAIGWQESGWWQGARSSTGAIGVMQLMPTTAAWLGPALLGRQINSYDVADNIDAGTAYLAYLQRHTGSRRLAIASYYQGMGSVTSRGLLGETERYVSSVASFIGRV